MGDSVWTSGGVRFWAMSSMPTPVPGPTPIPRGSTVHAQVCSVAQSKLVQAGYPADSAAELATLYAKAADILEKTSLSDLGSKALEAGDHLATYYGSFAGGKIVLAANRLIINGKEFGMVSQRVLAKMAERRMIGVGGVAAGVVDVFEVINENYFHMEINEKVYATSKVLLDAILLTDATVAAAVTVEIPGVDALTITLLSYAAYDFGKDVAKAQQAWSH